MPIPSTGDAIAPPPKLYLLLENPRKSNNLGPVLRCAAAFGISQIVAVGFDKCSTQGSHGAAKHVSMIAFPTVEQAVAYLRGQEECKSLVGLMGGVPDAYDHIGYSVLEQDETFYVAPGVYNETTTIYRSYPIHSRPFVEGNCCFVIGKLSRGLPSSLAKHCDFFIHVPHVNVIEEDTRLLDVPSCLSISLHHFTSWAQYDKRDFQGHKYKKGLALQRNSDEREAARLARAVARQQLQEASEAAIEGDAIAGMFCEAAADDY